MKVKEFWLIKILVLLFVFKLIYSNEEKLTSRLKITSTPSAAAVFINNVFKGNTPLDIEIPPGQHRIRIAIDDNYVPEYITLIAFAKNTYEYNINLKLNTRGSYRAATRYYIEGDLQKAKYYYLLSTKSYGKTIPEAYYYAGYIDFLLKNFEESEKNLLNYISYNSKSVSTWFLLGEIRNTINKKNLAIASYKECLKILYPKTESLLLSTPITQNELERLKKEILIYPTLDNYIKIARIFEQKGDFENAIYYYRKAVFFFEIELDKPYSFSTKENNED
ncbi:MAG: PEGA domain-containing protein [bacterium]